MVRTTISKGFRELLIAELPGLQRNPAYWGLLGWTMFGRLTEYEGVLVSQETLARLESKEHQVKNRNYSGVQFLEAFKRDVAPRMEWREFSYSEGKAREVTTLGLPDEVMRGLDAERATPAHQLNDRVYLETGHKWSAARQKQQRDVDRTSAMQLLDNAGCEEARRLMAYLNSLPAHRFTKLLQHLDAAYDVAGQLENPMSRERAYRLLRHIADQPQPLYGPTGNGRTVRLFSSNESLCRLPRPVRRVLTHDWTSVDLRSAQLAIVGRLWDVPAVEDLLHSGTSVWHHLCEKLGIPFSEDTKKGVKQMVYALVFGSGKRKGSATDQAARHYFPEDSSIVTRFFQVPVVDALYHRREVEKERVIAAGGAKDAFGNWIALPADEYGKPNARSVLASQAQSYELRLLWPVIEEAMTTDQFDVTVYLFDGLCLAFKDTSKRERILGRLQGKVAAVSEELGMPTALVVE